MKDRKIKYYACGEYGEKNNRPHYHAIILGIGIDEHEVEPIDQSDYSKGFKALKGPLVEAWDIGFVLVGTVNVHSARYVADYLDPERYKGNYGDREKPFKIQSQGLGKTWVLENSDQLFDQMGVLMRGKVLGMPVYYQRMLTKDIENKVAFSMEAYESKYKKAKELYGRGFKTEIERVDQERREEFQNYRNYLAKQESKTHRDSDL